MTAVLLRTRMRCLECGRHLTLEEMHYYERPDGSASCDACERAWLRSVSQWRLGGQDDDFMPWLSLRAEPEDAA